MTNAGEALLHLETIKLLLQVAWADLEVESREAALILAKAEEMGLPPNALSEIQSYLSGEQPLPPPDLQMLKEHGAKVLEAVLSVLHADGRVTTDEDEILGTIRTLLGVDS